MKKFFLLLLLAAALLSGCDQSTSGVGETSLNTAALAAPNPNEGDWVRPDGVTELYSTPIADYVITDQGLVAYDYMSPSNAGLDPSEVKGILLAPETNSSVEIVKAALDQANAARSDFEKTNTEGLGTAATGTSCLILREGCYYLVESDKYDNFNAVWTRVYLPSRAKGEIRVEEDNFSACPGNKTNKFEVPYIFLGGHSKGSLPPFPTQQNIDSGLLWQCGSDSWAPFMNFSGSAKDFSSTYRLPAGQEVRMVFYIRSFSAYVHLPRLLIIGNYIGRDGANHTGWVRVTCSEVTCGGGKWDISGVDQNFRLEVNLAQGETINGVKVQKRLSNSRALFDNAQVRGLYLGNVLFNASTQRYYWANASKWNVSASKSSSSLTEVQCITPPSNYTITGTANQGAAGAKIKINVLY